ncbi:MAG TPA: hypothetical protein DCM54_12520 [Gammaproteobacteria bacterium]|nr:hypothetical protein [Gammaproteobacteria bacterium]
MLHALDRAGFACCFAQDEILQTHSAQNGELQSAFIHGVYVLTQQWTVDAGVRFSKFDKDYSHQPRGWRQSNRVIPSKRNFIGKHTWEEATPTLGVSYRVDNEAMIYLRYSTGYLPGGYDENALSVDTAQPTDSQTSDSWEIGMNSEGMDDALRLNMSYFQIDHDDKIEQYPILR